MTRSANQLQYIHEYKYLQLTESTIHFLVLTYSCGAVVFIYLQPVLYCIVQGVSVPELSAVFVYLRLFVNAAVTCQFPA